VVRERLPERLRHELGTLIRDGVTGSAEAECRAREETSDLGSVRLRQEDADGQGDAGEDEWGAGARGPCPTDWRGCQPSP